MTATTSGARAARRARAGHGPTAARLRIADLARLAVVGLRTRKLRAALSALGIAIGVAAIVAVLGLSSSSAAGLNAEIAALGTNLLTVQPGQGLTGATAELQAAAPAMIARLPGVYQVQSTGATADRGALEPLAAHRADPHPNGMNHMARHGSRGGAGPWRARALTAAVTASLLLLAYAERLFLARIAVELLVRLAQITGLADAQPGTVLALGGALPGPAGLGFEVLRAAGVLLVEDPEREGVLPGQVGLHAEIPESRAGDHAVVVVAEQRLDLLDALGEAPGLLAERGADGLGRVPGMLGRLARLVQGSVPARPGGRVPCPAHPPAQPAPRVPDRGRQHLGRGPARLGRQRRIDEQRVQAVEQGQVAVAVQDLEHCGAGLGLDRREVSPHPGPHRAHDQFRRQFAQAGLQVPGQDLGVACGAEHAAEPVQLVPKPRTVFCAQHPAEGLQRAAQPPGGHPHLMDRVRRVTAHRRIERHDRRYLGPGIGQDHVRRRREREPGRGCR